MFSCCYSDENYFAEHYFGECHSSWYHSAECYIALSLR
jgi:hypothetical protein